MKKMYFLILVVIHFSCEPEEYVSLDENQGQNPIVSIKNGNGNGLDKNLTKALEDASGGIGAPFFTLPDSDDYANIPQDPLNPITAEKVALGQLLFHETAMGGSPKVSSNLFTYSCASCHHVAAGFSSGLRQGVGEAGLGFGVNGNGRVIDPSVATNLVDIQPIRSPTVLNVAYQDIMLWNGQFGGTGTNAGTEASWTNIPENFLGFQGVEVQAIKGQGVHRLLVDDNFVNTFGYKQMFDNAFPNVPVNERYSTNTAALAIAAYERTVLPNQSPWQQWLKGDTVVLTKEEKRGAMVFFGKGKCYECHTGPALNDKGFYSFGMGDFDNSNLAIVVDPVGFDNVKKGRGGFTKNAADDYKFKTPTLYNLIDSGFFGHGGTFTTIEEVIEYKNDGVAQSNEVPVQNLASQFGTINLTKKEIENLTLFIKNSLRDPNLIRYVPIAVYSGNCFPNNDPQSKTDLGCN